jgi:hypothetical protein
MTEKTKKDAPAEESAPESEPQVEGALSPPFITVTFQDGQSAIIPVDFSCVLQVIGPHGEIRATVGLTGVTGLEIAL